MERLDSQDRAHSAGKPIVVISGRLISLTRSAAIDLLARNGARYARSVTRQTSLLVLGLGSWPLRQDGGISNHLKRARRLQQRGISIEIMREDAWLASLGLADEERLICGRYTLEQVSDLSGVSASRIQGWLRAGLVAAGDASQGIEWFAFGQIAALKRLENLSRAGVSVACLRQSLRRLGAWLPEAAEVLCRLDLLNARRLIVRMENGALAEPNGQRLFDFMAPADPVLAAYHNLSLPDGLPDVDELFARALALEETGQFDEAEAAYRQWLLRFGPDSRVCFNLGNVLDARGSREAACERFRQAVEIDPDFVDAWHNLGITLSKLERHEQSLSASQRALEIDPNHPGAIFNLAQTLEELCRSSEARIHWEAYLSLDADGPWANYARACLGREGA